MGRSSAAALLAVLALASPAAAQVNWTFRGPVVPLARVENAMVYDSGNQRMVTFGGYDLNFNRTNDVWEYDGVTRTWANVSAPGPVVRQGAAMAYDGPRLHPHVRRYGRRGDGARRHLGVGRGRQDVVAALAFAVATRAVRVAHGVRRRQRRIVLHGGWNPGTGTLFSDT